MRQDNLESSRPLKILVIGAGIGGLATAVSLALKGHRVTVYEQAPALAEVSANILFPSRASADTAVIGWSRYTNPA